MYMRTLYFSACVCAHACMLGAPGHTRADKAPYPLQPVPRLARDSTRVLGVIIRWTPGRPEEGETQHPALSLPPGRRPVNTCQAQASCTPLVNLAAVRACSQLTPVTSYFTRSASAFSFVIWGVRGLSFLCVFLKWKCVSETSMGSTVKCRINSVILDWEKPYVI